MGTKLELTKPKPGHITKPASQNPALKNNTKPQPKPLFLENSIKRLNQPILVKESAVCRVNSVYLTFRHFELIWSKKNTNFNLKKIPRCL